MCNRDDVCESVRCGGGKRDGWDSMTAKLIRKLLEMSCFFQLSNTHRPPSPLSFFHSVFPAI